jgi:hypothetical protein
MGDRSNQTMLKKRNIIRNIHRRTEQMKVTRQEANPVAFETPYIYILGASPRRAVKGSHRPREFSVLV